MKINSGYKLPFRGYQEDMKLCEDTVKNIRRMNLHSNTAVNLRASHDYKLMGKKVRPEIYRYLYDLGSDYSREVSSTNGEIMSNFSKFELPKDYKSFGKCIREIITRHKAVNCGEQAFIAQDDLLNKGKKADVVHFDIAVKAYGDYDQERQHTFAVLNLAKDADIQNPKTWGQDAIIVDPWSGLVKRACQGIEFFKDIFDFDKDKETMYFSKAKNLFEESIK